MSFIIALLAVFFVVLFSVLFTKLAKEKKLAKAKENLDKVETKVDIHNINKKTTKLKSKLKK